MIAKSLPYRPHPEGPPPLLAPWWGIFDTPPQSNSGLLYQNFSLSNFDQLFQKIFDIDSNKNVLEYPFPYGYQQFVRDGNVDGERLIKQVNSRVESEFLSERDNREVIYVSGLTKLENLNANGKRYKCITGLLKKELARCKKNDKISMSRTNFRTICFLTEDLV